MDVDFTKAFNKQFDKLTSKRQQQAVNAIALFVEEEYATPLRNHGLKGVWSGYRSISVGGDLRLHYKVIAKTKVLFVAVGSHSQLYK
jgi:addiction module RelE/StbE family toxin